jgi:serine/threonine protein phosphatase PrpC
MKIEYFGNTDVGRVREHNEDNYSLLPDYNLVVVCDGMGGHAAGEVASGIAVDTIRSIFSESDRKFFEREPFTYPEELTANGKLLVGAISVANQRVLDHSKQDRALAGMGTTVVACQFHDGVVSICHVGDSRAYLIREGSIKRMTIDHSWVNELMEKHHLTEEESKSYVNSNVITRALGTKLGVQVDISEVIFKTGDLFLLCSDGLTGLVSDSEILSSSGANEGNPQGLVDELIRMANEAGGNDNITVCVARVVDQEPIANFEEIRRATIDWEDEFQLEEIYTIIDNMFTSNATTRGSLSDTDTDPIRINSKKKRVRFLNTLLILVCLAAIVLIAFYLDLL